jgi:hypothetical protein
MALGRRGAIIIFGALIGLARELPALGPWVLKPGAGG